MNAPNQHDYQQHCRLLGWLHIVGHAVFLVIGLFIFVLLTGIGAAVAGEDPAAPRILTLVGTGVGLLLATLSLPGLAAGYGLLTRKPWARFVALVVGVLGLVNVPLGTAIGVYTLWVLMRPESEAYFQPDRPIQTAA